MILSQNEKGFGMKDIDEEQFEIGSEIALTIKNFSFFITGDLAFYANVLGMPSFSSYWCPWCLLSCPQWQTQVINQPTGQKHTADSRMRCITKMIQGRDLQHKIKKGFQLQCITHHLLHTTLFCHCFILIEMANMVWDSFELWMDRLA
jgi:hypothetical protein